MVKALTYILMISMCFACQQKENKTNAAQIKNEIAKMKTKIDMDVQGFDWQGESINREVLNHFNGILNDGRINPSLTSKCRPPSASNPTIRYQEHYRCGSAISIDASCELWTATIPINKANSHVDKISEDEASLILHKAINYSNINTPRCSCQKTASVPIRYSLQAKAFKDETNQTITKKIWVMTTYNCCGKCNTN